MFGMHKKNKAYSNRFLSIAVLIGFLSLQFHSFSHIDLDKLSSDERAHQTENTTTSQIHGHSSSDEDISVDCPDCVLTKHLQADISQEAIPFHNEDVSFVSGIENSLVFESIHHLFQLRAPPFYAI